MFQKFKDRKHKKEIQQSLKDFWMVVDRGGKLGDNSILHQSLDKILSQKLISVGTIDPTYLRNPLINVIARESFSPNSVALLDLALSKGMPLTAKDLQYIINHMGSHYRHSVDEAPTDRWSAGWRRISDPPFSTQFEISDFVYNFLNTLTKHGAPWDDQVNNPGFHGTLAQYLRIKPPSPRFHNEQQQQVFERYFERVTAIDAMDIVTVDVEPNKLDVAQIIERLEERRNTDPNSPFNDMIKNNYR